LRLKLFAPHVLLLIALLSCVPCFSQDPSLGNSRPHMGAPDDRDKEVRAQIEKDMAKKANQERQVQLQRDADNLLKLATELKQYVDKTNEHTLSVDVIKKAEEIEKLAHSVKEKMKAN
jgi:hypothetical protein